MTALVSVEIAPLGLDIDGLFNSSPEPIGFFVQSFNIVPVYVMSCFLVVPDRGVDGARSAMFDNSSVQSTGGFADISRIAVIAIELVDGATTFAGRDFVFR